jgi:hypothetical protein
LSDLGAIIVTCNDEGACKTATSRFMELVSSSSSSTIGKNQLFTIRGSERFIVRFQEKLTSKQICQRYLRFNSLFSRFLRHALAIKHAAEQMVKDNLFS